MIMDYAYGGGPLLLSVGILGAKALQHQEAPSPQEVAQHLDQTTCSRDKCHMGGFSARAQQSRCRRREDMYMPKESSLPVERQAYFSCNRYHVVDVDFYQGSGPDEQGVLFVGS